MLGGNDDKYPQFSSYVFTDISTGFFEKAQTKFKAWGSLISYKSLNIEEDLQAQGFGEYEKFDIVVAANVLHATHNMDHTMRQVNKLLKPEGKLILVEGTAFRQITGGSIFGLLPGWWMGKRENMFRFNSADPSTGVAEGRTDSPLLSEGQWTSLLKRTGYSGLDLCLRDSLDEELWTMSMMVSAKENDNAGVDPYDIRIIYDILQEQDLVNSLAKELQSLSGKKPLISTLSEADPSDELIVIVDHASGSLLLGLEEKRLEGLKSVFAQAKGVLWITFDYSGNEKEAGAGAVSGILRSLRSENGGMTYVNCDIEVDDLPAPELARVISKVFAKVFSKSNMDSSVKDFEFVYKNGRIMIPRLVEDKLANEACMTQLSKRELEEQSLWQEDSRLHLDMGHFGLLDTLQFVHSESFSAKIPHDEVEIDVKTVGLNFRDLLVATGQLTESKGFGYECAGIITKVGKGTHNVKVGDRVCAFANDCYANLVRTPGDFTSIMPDSMSFETGASIPCVFTTAYFCIYLAARLQKNESILIHSAAGATGQACIKMAQNVGAKIFATVGSPAKVDFLEKTYGLPRSHILNSRTLRFGREIMKLTEGKGVDVIINSLAGDALRESWRCMAMFGRFLELGKKDALENGRLDMAPFLKSVSFIAASWNQYEAHRPEVAGGVLRDIMALFANGTLTPLEPITTFPMSEIEPAFRFMASGNHIGKIVVTAGRDCFVKVRMNGRRSFWY